MNTTNNEAAFQLSVYKYSIVLALLIVLVYASVLFFPYLLLDDNWLLRRSEGTPTIDFVAGIQGRPVFAFLIRLTRELTGNSDTPVSVMSTIRFVRLLAIILLCGFAIGLFRWLILWGSTVHVAFMTAVVAVTLPSLAMYILGGPWLTVALIGSLISVHLILRAVRAERVTGIVLWSLSAMATQSLCWATYQGTAPVAGALILIAFIGSTQADWDFKRGIYALSERARFVLLGLVVFFFGLLVYVVLWKLAFYYFYTGVKETRYAPTNINILNISVLEQFKNIRVTQIFNMWNVSGAMWVPTVFYWVSCLAIALGVLKDMQGQSKIFALGKWLLVAIAFLLLDLPALSANDSTGNPSPLFSYMTSAALALTLACIFGYRFFPLIAEGSNPRRQGLLVGIVLVMALTMCMRTAATHFAVPLWLEYRYVRSEIERFNALHGGVEGVRIKERGQALLNVGSSEFGWSNLGSSFYIHWTIRNVLDELRLKSRIRIDVITSAGQVLTSADYDREPDPSKIVTIDVVHLRLR